MTTLDITLCHTAANGHHDVFGGVATHLVQAPGRVNLIGEHTDYNDGFVLPCAINHGTVVACSPRADLLVRVIAMDYLAAPDEFRLDGKPTHVTVAEWPNYVRGVLWLLWSEGYPIRGANLVITGDVPQGAGLSSSASLELALLQAFKTMYGLTDLDPTRMAQLAQRAENEFVGCKCGIMDQLISARGQAGHAVQIDCRSLETRPVPMPADTAVLIAHSRVRRGLVDSAYNERREQCEQAAAHFGVKALRDVSPEQLARNGAGLPPLVLRRVRHVVTENQRVLDASAALQAGDLRTLGQLMAQSHDSMRDDFEITVPAIDELVAILQEVIGDEGGARMTGGGFGGCVVALLPQARVAAAQQALAKRYRSPEGEPALVYLCKASDGAGLLG